MQIRFATRRTVVAMKTLALLVGILILSLGLVGVIMPGALVTLALHAVTQTGLYVVAVVRAAIGFVLIGAASTSRKPATLRTFGFVALIAGLTTPFVGIERAQAMMNWWLSMDPIVMRLAAAFVVAIGSFIVYAVTGRRSRY